jgi:hypothetical protein
MSSRRTGTTFANSLAYPGKLPAIFLLPCGLRPVKDVLFLFPTIARWHHDAKARDLALHIPYLAVAGPVLDPLYARNVFSWVGNLMKIYL